MRRYEIGHKVRITITTIALLTLIAAPAIAETPTKLSDAEFWKLVSDFSEPSGAFHSENLVSNERLFQTVIPHLVETVKPGRPYIGVGSEQNFTYIAALRPSIAFIVDIRRGNLDLHLIYKALFELSADRADFVSRLFSRPRPVGLKTSSAVEEIFAAYSKAAPSQELYERNLKEIKALLRERHGLQLSSGDIEGIEFVYSEWFKAGVDIRYELNGGGFATAPSRGGGAGGRGIGGLPSYAELMTANDGAGKNRSYLATEEAFRFVKDLETRNLIVPIVGNFGGPKALRAVGAYLKQQGAVVSAFYVSNVEQYLREDGSWNTFCESAATLPTDTSSTFIRSSRGGFQGQRGFRGLPQRGGAEFVMTLAPMESQLAQCAGK